MSETVQLGVRVAADALARIDAAGERLGLSRAQIIEILARQCADRLVFADDLPERIPTPRPPGGKRGPGRKPKPKDGH
jgi:hypothetical protein